MSRRLKAESQLLPCSANAIIKTQEFDAPNGGTGRQCGRQVNGVERADRFRGKRAPRPINDFRAQSQHLPMRRPCVQIGASIGCGPLVDLTKSHRAAQHAITLKKCEIRRNDKLGVAQHLSNAPRGIFPE